MSREEEFPETREGIWGVTPEKRAEIEAKQDQPMSYGKTAEHLDRVRELGIMTLEDVFPEDQPEGFYELPGDLG